MATPQKQIPFHGRMMTAREIKAWVDENRNYTIAAGTILDRYAQGFEEDELIERPMARNQQTKRLPRQKLVRVSVPGWGVRTG